MYSIIRMTPRILLLVGAFAIPLVPTSGLAQQPGQLTAQQFQANPGQLLTNFPDGGASMISASPES